MPRPRNARQALEEELAEIPGQLAAYRQEMENGRPHKARRERLEWQIREREKRLAEIEARLAAINKAGRSGGISLG
jgi:chromosome segregation ATPase